MRIDKTLAYFFPETHYGGFSDSDGTIRFFARVNAMLTSEGTALDIGCGRGKHSEDAVAFRRDLCRLRGKCRKVVGIDVDTAGAENPNIDEFVHLADPAGAWPLPDNSFDLALSTMVIEHVPDPLAFCSEVFRVLKPGGTLCLRTSNQLSYLGLAASVIPNSMHARVLKMTRDPRTEADIFPTLYRCNTKFKLRKTLRQAGFERVVVKGFGGEPTYLRFSKLAYFAGLLYVRFLPDFLQQTLFAFATRPA